MSNQIRNAIDTGLSGLCVTGSDVAAVCRYVRQADAPKASRRARFDWRLATAMAVVMLALVAAVSLRLTGLLPLGGEAPEMHSLTQPEVTEVPAGFVPVDAAVVNIDAARAIALAEEYVLTHHDETARLREASDYEIRCEYRAEDGARRNVYAVEFRCLTLEGTDYTVFVSARDGQVIDCDVTRGAQPGHTAWEIWWGHARLYGPDRRTWTNEQLRDYCKMLRKAASGTMAWEDYLYLLSSYPDVAEGAMSREAVIAAVEDDLDVLLFEYDGQFGDGRWTDAERIGGLRARYISAYPNPVWQVACDQRVVNQEGYETVRTILVEVDSVTGQVKQVTAVDAVCNVWHEGFTRSTVEALTATTTSGKGHPGLTDEAANAIAADYVSRRWGEGRNVADPALFTREENTGDHPTIQCPVELVFTSKDGPEVTQYVFYIDDYGQVQAANRSVTPAGAGEPFTPTAPALDWYIESLLKWQDRARASAQAEDPAVKAFIATTWIQDYAEGSYGAARQAAFDHLHVRTATHFRAVLIDARPHPVWKLAFNSDQGSFLVEVDSETNEILHVLEVEGIHQNWYLPFVLTADLKAAGVPIPEDAAPAPLTDSPCDVYDGMRVDHLYMRFKQLYGPDMGRWTPAQLRTFQAAAVLSSDFDYDLGVFCLRRTVYPDVPENAITPEAAMNGAATAINLGEAGNWQLCGAVLIGTPDDSPTSGTPVWKICMRHTTGDFWYAEVNCMTGRVIRLHQDATGAASPGASYDYGTPQNLWFRDIVLEDTIDDCEAVWDCRGNG